MPAKETYTWEYVDSLVCDVIAQLNADDYDAILAVTRGGMIPACLISERLDIRQILTAAVMFYTSEGETLREPHFFQFPSDPLLYKKRILIVDDIWDSGKTAVAVKSKVTGAGGRAQVAVIDYKPQNNRFEEVPDFFARETDAWIVYPWEKECN